MNSSVTAASVQELWRNMMAQAMEIWAPSDFHFLELTYPRFLELLPEFDHSISEFSQTAYACASEKNLKAVQELHRGFSSWMALCDIPIHFCGKVHRGNYDLLKFVAHELFVTLVASLLHHEFPEALDAILAEDWGRRYQTRLRYSSAFLQYSSLLAGEGAVSLKLVSELLAERHGEGGRFSACCPLKDFQEAELFLSQHPQSQELCPAN